MGVNGEELRALWAPDPDGPEPEKCPEMDWDLIYKPLKYFWFARQEIGSRHPLNVCVCVCVHALAHVCPGHQLEASCAWLVISSMPTNMHVTEGIVCY